MKYVVGADNVFGVPVSSPVADLTDKVPLVFPLKL